MNKTEAKNAFNAKNYDRLNIFVHKGRRADIQKHAASLGLSVNRYVVGLIQRDLEGAQEREKKDQG